MTKEEISALWPDWKIEFVCNYACKKLRELKGLNFVYLKNSGWIDDPDELPEEKEKEAAIYIWFEKKDSGHAIRFTFGPYLFMNVKLPADDKNGADKVQEARDKAILRIAWQLKKCWSGKGEEDREYEI